MNNKRYIIDRLLHWLSAAAIIFLLFDMGTRIHNIDYRLKGATTHKQDAIEIHITIALLLALILIARLIWYHFFLPTKHQINYYSAAHKLLVRLMHTAMYFTLFSLMLTGLIMVTNYEHALTFFNWITFTNQQAIRADFLLANTWHLYLETTIYALIIIHIAGVVYQRR